MSGSTTKRIISAYFQEATPTAFLTSFFRTPEMNFHDTEEVEIDIERSGESIATVITDLSTGGHVNTFDGYTNKSFTPPLFNEVGTLNSFDLMKRNAGDNPFQNPSFQANAAMKAFKTFRLLENKVRRSVEHMASQVFQQCKLTLVDDKGNGAYLLDFKPKATHYPTVSVAWSNAASDKIGDVMALAKVIRTDGLSKPNVLIFGELAFQQWIDDEKVKERLDNRNMTVGQIAPESRGEGSTFQGYIWLGNYRYEMWTYDGQCENPVTKDSETYVNDDSVIVLADNARLDLTFGSIPLIQQQGQSISALPRRMTSTKNGFGMTTNSWVNREGTVLNVSAGTRPLTIPTSIDRIGCLKTNP